MTHLRLTRPFDEVVDEILAVIHDNVQLYDELGKEANRDVLDALKPCIGEAIINCRAGGREIDL
jgi:hypothetical protein|tara:strand:- start:616 stop:807 length:192 start_codon:yes stop_codon:yes gene_type:complete